MIKVCMQSLKAHQQSISHMQRWVYAYEPQLYTPKIQKHRNVQFREVYKGKRLAPEPQSRTLNTKIFGDDLENNVENFLIKMIT